MIWILLTLGLLLLALLLDRLCRMGLGALAWGNRRCPQIAITVDADLGTDTRQFRELLDAYHVPATFFVHSVAGATFYRPPGDRPSLLSHVSCRFTGRKIVLWDLDVESMRRSNVGDIVKSVLFNVQPGSILRFRADGPQTNEILQGLLPALLRLGYQPVELGQMDLRPLNTRETIQRAFLAYERYCNRVHNIERIGFGPYDICRVERKPFEGPAVPGCRVGAPSIELHFESVRVAALNTFAAIRTFREGLRGVAKILAEENDIRIVYAKSCFAPWANRCYFRSLSLPWVDDWLGRIGGAFLRWLYGEGNVSLDRLLYPSTMAFLSRSEFLERWYSVMADDDVIREPAKVDA